jgi:hypothetical protein
VVPTTLVGAKSLVAPMALPARLEP